VTLQQGCAFAILLAMMVLFVWGRLRYDLVALSALLAAVVTGIVPGDRAFAGFGDPILAIVASALVVSAAITHSGIVDTILRPVSLYVTTPQRQIVVLVPTVTLLSALMKNVGALAMLMPVALQMAQRSKTSPSCLLMPLAFGSLLGGLMTLIGTSPNLIVSRVREEITGEPFQMFDFLPVGGAIAAAGTLFLLFGYRLLPAARQGAASLDAAMEGRAFTAEAQLRDSPFVGRTVAELEAGSDDTVSVELIVREKFRRYTPQPDWVLQPEDVLLLNGAPDALERLVHEARLTLPSPQGKAEGSDPESSDVVQAVVMADSPAVGKSPEEVRLAERFDLDLLAMSRSGERVTHRLRAMKLSAGDLVVVKGETARLPEALRELGFLPLGGRNLYLGQARRRWLPVALMAIAMALAALRVVPVQIAFFAAAVLLILSGSLTLRRAYEAIDGPILVLLGALIPVSEALRTTGGTEIIAHWLFYGAQSLSGTGAIVLMLVAAMAVTPFLNNAATVLMAAPIGASLSAQLGYAADPFLMAVAVGAACDFLTPFGHQCNTLVMGPGGYRFADYWRLGLPLSLIVIALGAVIIPIVWPLSP
jgi:di/tricarboxylate transporter